MSGRTGGKRSRRARIGRAGLVLIVLGIVVHLLLPQVAELEQSLSVLREMKVWALGLAVLGQAGAFAGNGFLLATLVRLFRHRITVLRGTLITVASWSIGLVWGGQITSASAAYHWLRATRVSGSGAAMAGWLPVFFRIFALSAVSIFGLAYLIIWHELSRFLAFSFGGAVLLLVAVTGAALWGVRHREQVTRVLRWSGRKIARVRRREYDPAIADATADRLFQAWRLLWRGGWRYSLLAMVLFVTFDVLSLYFVFVAAGYRVSPGILLAGYGLPLLLGKLAVIPGGVGVVEASMVGLYQLLGVPRGVTVVVVLTYRLLSFWIPILAGFPLIPYLNRSGGSATRARPTEETLPGRQVEPPGSG
jgi:glycosyltransferase 2 family protein